MLLLQLLGRISGAKPHTIQDVETHVSATFAYPIDVWSINEAREKLQRLASKKRGVFLFPIDKIHLLMIVGVAGVGGRGFILCIYAGHVRI